MITKAGQSSMSWVQNIVEPNQIALFANLDNLNSTVTRQERETVAFCDGAGASNMPLKQKGYNL